MFRGAVFSGHGVETLLLLDKPHDTSPVEISGGFVSDSWVLLYCDWTSAVVCDANMQYVCLDISVLRY